jgi:predicted chitinase
MTNLLVVDPLTKNVVIDIYQSIGNWRSHDAIDFHGRGPIQLTGRHNFQLFADNVGNQSIMTNPSQVSDMSHPLLGLKSAGWFWEVALEHRLNEVCNANTG